jgi:hypothetical protein
VLLKVGPGAHDRIRLHRSLEHRRFLSPSCEYVNLLLYLRPL